MPTKPQDPDLLVINTIRTLAMDAVQAANSGHPGTPMALAPVVYYLWQVPVAGLPALRSRGPDLAQPRPVRALQRSRLDAAVLHAASHQLSVTLEDIERFRQLGSKCPGHPEYRLTSGVETTTGPLGRQSRPASGWRSRAAGRPPTSTVRGSSCSITPSMPCVVTVT
jgi:transketolase